MSCAWRSHRAHTKVNLAEGAGNNSTFRFVGPDGVLTIGDNAVLARGQRAKEPGLTADTFGKATEEAFLKEFRTKYPDRPELRPGHYEVNAAPARYNSTKDHFQTLFNVRSRRPVVEDAVFGLGAAGPALLANHSVFENTLYGMPSG